MSLYKPKFKLSTWAAAKAAIAESASAGSAAVQPFIIVCFVHQWIPPAVHTGEVLSMYVDSGRVPGVGLFVIDADTEPTVCAERGITAGPATMFFIRGQPVRVRRPGFRENDMLVGDLSTQQWGDLLGAARELALAKTAGGTDAVLTVDV